ncbi:hypothetical protein CBM2586_B10223 [Cupriavidus phytorum]|uniref:Uncharacterized protein n=1 Tax=Cupriavidus taiwanensis TaxID=164546 RepID=A0A375C909_9BURK|nr:hypothetical protein CBM2586_B10223 [Cupriavidus taiwanensis]
MWPVISMVCIDRSLYPARCGPGWLGGKSQEFLRLFVAELTFVISHSVHEVLERSLSALIGLRLAKEGFQFCFALCAHLSAPVCCPHRCAFVVGSIVSDAYTECKQCFRYFSAVLTRWAQKSPPGGRACRVLEG